MPDESSWRSIAVLLGAAFIPGARAAGSDPPGACSTVPLFEAGHAVRPVCAEQRNADFTVVDLADEWTPAVFTETPDRPQGYRGTFIALANERFGAGREWETARRDRYFELYGIFPSLSVIRARLLDEARHACHAAVDDGPLRAVKRPLAPWMLTSGADEIDGRGAGRRASPPAVRGAARGRSRRRCLRRTHAGEPARLPAAAHAPVGGDPRRRDARRAADRQPRAGLSDAAARAPRTCGRCHRPHRGRLGAERLGADPGTFRRVGGVPARDAAAASPGRRSGSDRPRDGSGGRRARLDVARVGVPGARLRPAAAGRAPPAPAACLSHEGDDAQGGDRSRRRLAFLPIRRRRPAPTISGQEPADVRPVRRHRGGGGSARALADHDRRLEGRERGRFGEPSLQGIPGRAALLARARGGAGLVSATDDARSRAGAPPSRWKVGR